MTETKIHPTAVLGDRVELGNGVEIGPYVIIEDDVVIGDKTRLMAHDYIGRYTEIGSDNVVFPFTTIGMVPQDLKFQNEPTKVIIGKRNTIREHVTIHRGTSHGLAYTRIDDDNLLMVGSHVAHDCTVGSHTILSHGCTLAGHVAVGSHATVGAYSGVHQYCRVADYAFIGGFSVITQDALPFIKSVGNRAKIYGINTVGLQRSGVSEDEIKNLRSAYRILFQKGLLLKDALATLKADYPDSPQVSYLVEFIEQSERGVVR